MSLEFLLKSFKEEDKDEGVSLTGVLQRKRLKLQRQKKSRKATPYFSPYNVGYGFCMREKVAQLAGYHDILIKPPTPKEKFVMDVGKKYHELLQRYFWQCGILEGEWKCDFCGKEWYDRSPQMCPECGYTSWIKYREVSLENKQYRIRGRADGILYVEVNGVEERHLVDIKSISNRGAQQSHQDPRVCFEDLDIQGPIQPHVVQLSCYQMMSNIDDAHLLYVAKNDQRMKSFHIKYNELVLKPYLDSIQEAIEWSNELKDKKRKDLPAPCDRKKCECQDIIRV